jgi:predicted molibdopterin-dependent oxidoreductase YjgC
VASSFEKTGTFTNMERRVQMVRPLFGPPGEARADWEIYAELADRLGYPMRYANSGEIMAEISDLLPSYAGIRHERLESGGLHWPIRRGEPNGESILHAQRFARGKGRFRPLSWTERDADTAREYPYVLITGRQREQYHTGTMTRRSPIAETLSEGPVVEMNTEDMLRDGLTPGARVRVISSQGTVEAKVGASPALPRGMLFTTFHYSELPVNRLTPPTLDSITKTPAYKDARVRLARIP